MSSSRIAIIFTPVVNRIILPKLGNLNGKVHSITVFLHSDVSVQVSESISTITEVVTVDDEDGYYIALNRKLYSLVNADVPILFVSPEYYFDVDSIASLLECLEVDPLYGFAFPRTNLGGSAPVPRVKGEPPVQNPEVFDEFLAVLPPRFGNGLFQRPPVLVQASVLYNFGRLEGKSFDLSDALVRLFIRANRRGFGCVVCNRSFFFADEEHAFQGGVPAPVIEHAADYSRALSRILELPENRLQKLLWARLRPKPSREILFDIRNLPPIYNGTAELILSLIRPLSTLADRFNMKVCFWASEESADFHQLNQMIPGQLLFYLGEDDLFDAIIRLSQPWSFSELGDQASHSMINIYSMLDTIAWDCHYIRMRHLDGLWRAMAEYSDGFIYISRFSQDRFHERFPLARSVPSAVAYCSLDPLEYYVPVSALQAPKDTNLFKPYFLLVGNHYHHKGLREVIRLIATSFPETLIKVIGESPDEYCNVEYISSGRMANQEVDELFRHCICVIFPSYYEGFGLPILKGLAFGKVVVARESDLLEEIQSFVKPIDEIISFRRKTDLLRVLRNILSREVTCSNRKHQPVRPVKAFTWGSGAQEIFELINKELNNINIENCLRRLEFFYCSTQLALTAASCMDANQNKIIFEVEE